jgi:hypothetical protein
MPTAMRLHDNLLRRHLRYCGVYVVKTEGDAFMCSFPTTLAAMWWCLTVHMQFLREFWPLEILECDEGKEVHDEHENLLARGLSVRMGVHCGTPMCESDPSLVTWIISGLWSFEPLVSAGTRQAGRSCTALPSFAKSTRKYSRRVRTRSTQSSSQLRLLRRSGVGCAMPAVRGFGFVQCLLSSTRTEGLCG